MRRTVATQAQVGWERLTPAQHEAPDAQGTRVDAPSTLLEVTFQFLATDDAVHPYPHSDGLPRFRQSGRLRS